MHYSREDEKVKTARYEGTREISGKAELRFQMIALFVYGNRVEPRILTGEERDLTARAYDHGITDRIPGMSFMYVEISGFQRNRLAAPLN